MDNYSKIAVKINAKENVEKERKEKNNISLKIKLLMLSIKERIYFKEICIAKKECRPLIISSDTSFQVKEDMSSYHEYYIKYKKTA